MIKGGPEMKRDDLELMHGGNASRELGRPNGDLAQVRAITAATIVRIIENRKLSTREAERLTGVSHSEFSRIRNTQLERFTLDRMIAILGKLDANIEVSVSFRTRKRSLPAAPRLPAAKPVRGIRRPTAARTVRKAQRP
jgi:predicted XRE-type DNA-binding protein